MLVQEGLQEASSAMVCTFSDTHENHYEASISLVDGAWYGSWCCQCHKMYCGGCKEPMEQFGQKEDPIVIFLCKGCGSSYHTSD